MSYLDLYRARVAPTPEESDNPTLSIMQRQFNTYFSTAPNRYLLIRCAVTGTTTIETGFYGVLQSVRHGEIENDSKYLVVENNTCLNSGEHVIWNDKTWLVMNEENNTIKTHKTFHIMLANYEIKWKSLSGELLSEIVYVDTMGNKMYSILETDYMTIGIRQVTIFCPKNGRTEQLERNSRLVVGHFAYEITYIDDYSREGIIAFTLVEDKSGGLDDMENGIANNDYTNQIDSTAVLVGNDKISIGYSEVYTINDTSGDTYTFAIDPLSTPLSAYTVLNETGLEIEIRCDEFMSTDYEVYSIKLTATNDVTSAEVEKEIRFRNIY